MTVTMLAGAAQAPAAPMYAVPDLTGRLTDLQLDVLLAGLHQSRVGTNPKGFAHVQQWDVRRFLIRVFGFGGFDTELVSIDCVRELQIPDGKDKYGNPSFRWTVVYRVHQRLTIKDVHGRPIAAFDGVATGDAQNQRSLGDAHDGAVKEADSQSLKRAAVNLGDTFGLCLYNGGRSDRTVQWSAAHPVDRSGRKAPEVQPDPPVLPEPGATAAAEETTVPADAVQIPRPETEAAAFEPHPQAQDIADEAASKAADQAGVNTRWRQAAEADVLNAGVVAPDIGLPDVLGAYLTRLGQQLPERVPHRADDEPAAEHPEPGAVAPDGSAPVDEHAAAVDELRVFGAELRIPDIDADAYLALGAPLDDLSPQVIRRFLAQLRSSTS